ncbi:hypothetical protein RJT34_10921 [Clitoria ternatea]|uniref:TIR domain-containing protein n=1 Tax=Clitoria ternatea TaxID=43366 RepID=A0AAN9JLQ7_CLITE
MDDDGLKAGHQISLSLVQAIQESRISVVVFSQNYAYSSWCLDELVEIVDCMKNKNQLVWPIFYKVPPCDVRHQRNSYGGAITKHEDRYGKDCEQVQKWRSALSHVANLKGWHFETGYEYEFIQRIVEMVMAKLHNEELDVGEHIIGHQSRIQEVRSLLDIESYGEVYMLGIHGTGGIGKTTLAKALYNLIHYQFECAIFLEGVRETSNNMGLLHLQETMQFKLLERKIIKLGSVDEGATSLKNQLRHRRILLVLDDVDSVDQLEKLAGNCNWFGSGSRIIITTRDNHVLNVHEVEKRYEMKELNDDEALQLFCWKAFKMNQPKLGYEDVSNCAVSYAKGLPLAIKVIGSNLVGKSVKECECALQQYEKIPDRKIQGILKVSYDSLPENAQHVFLDIACFLNGEKRDYVESILDKCGFFPTYNIGILVDRSLLTVDRHDILSMHDLIQDMGKEIVRQEAPKQPGQRSRLCYHEDVVSVLTEDSGSNNIEGIILDFPREEEVEVEWSGSAFKKMNNLRILIVRNARFSLAPDYLPNSLKLLEWKGYPSKSLPAGFYPKNAVVLSLPQSHFMLEKKLPLQVNRLQNLTYMNFSHCSFLTHVPDMTGFPNLKEFDFSECENLVSIHHSVGFLQKLEILRVQGCNKLRSFTPRMWLPSLQHFSFDCSRNIEIFPEIVGVMDKLKSINLLDTQIKELPGSVTNLIGLENIRMSSCKTLRDLPSNLFMLPNIKKIYIYGNHQVRESFRRFRKSLLISMPSHSALGELFCTDCGLTDEDLHFILSCFPNLERLLLPYNKFVFLPTRIQGCAKLTLLDVSFSMKLEEIPELPSTIQVVLARRCARISSETSRRLWSKAFEQVYKLRIVMPETRIPNWFDHHCEGGIVSFWARGKFPVVALAFLYKEMQPLTNSGEVLFFSDILSHYAIHVNLYINGIGVKNHNVGYTYGVDEGDHVVLCDFRSDVEVEKWPIFDTLNKYG